MRQPIGILIHQIKQIHARIFERVLRRHTNLDISGPQCNVLYQLWREEGITISKLSQRTQLTNATLTSMLDRLEAQHLLRRHINPENRREVLVILTQQANSLQILYQECYREMSDIKFKGFTPEERCQFEEYLQRFYHNLTAYEAQQKDEIF